MEYIVLICARGGSKGIPKKNLRKLLGKPLLVWSIELAKKLNMVSRVIVSTDSNEIAKVALENGAEVPFIRPIELSQDNSPEWLSWDHAVKYLKEKEGLKKFTLIVLPVTSPLRNKSDVERCIVEYEKGDSDIVITHSKAHRSPYFNMISSDKNGLYNLVIEPQKPIIRRQDSPEVFDMTTVAFIVSSEFVESNDHIFEGKVRSVLIPKERSIDIDSEFDLNIAKYLAENNKKNNEEN